MKLYQMFSYHRKTALQDAL